MFRFTVPHGATAEEFRKRLIDRAAGVLNTTSEEATRFVEMLEMIGQTRQTKVQDPPEVDPQLERKTVGSLAMAYYRRLANLLEVVSSGDTMMLDEGVEAFYLKIRSGFLKCLNDSDLAVALDEFDEWGFPASILELDPLETDWELMTEPAIRRNQALLLRTADAHGIPFHDPFAELFMVGYDENIATIRSYKRQGEKKLFDRIEAGIRQRELPPKTIPPGTATIEPRRDLSQPLRVFLSYAHRDERMLEHLNAHLKLLQREHLIDAWHDRKIGAGTEWKQCIDANLEAADLVLLLVSSSFVNSEYCWDKEMTKAMERHGKRESRVIPIILRPCDWHSAPFGKLQALPKDGKPITTWSNKDSAWLDVANSIRAAILDLSVS